MAAILDAEVSHPDDVNVEELGDYDLIGLGSESHLKSTISRLLEFVDALPALHVKAFILLTRGAPRGGSDHSALKSKLGEKGLTVVGAFSCRGFDTYGLMKLIGGYLKDARMSKTCAMQRNLLSHLKKAIGCRGVSAVAFSPLFLLERPEASRSRLGSDFIRLNVRFPRHHLGSAVNDFRLAGRSYIGNSSYPLWVTKWRS